MQKLPFFKISRTHACKMTLFLGFANSRLPLKKYPFFAKMGTSVVYVLVGSRGPGRNYWYSNHLELIVAKNIYTYGNTCVYFYRIKETGIFKQRNIRLDILILNSLSHIAMMPSRLNAIVNETGLKTITCFDICFSWLFVTYSHWLIWTYTDDPMIFVCENNRFCGFWGSDFGGK